MMASNFGLILVSMKSLSLILSLSACCLAMFRFSALSSTICDSIGFLAYFAINFLFLSLNASGFVNFGDYSGTTYSVC